jgi:hypothetical protein
LVALERFRRGVGAGVGGVRDFANDSRYVPHAVVWEMVGCAEAERLKGHMCFSRMAYVEVKTGRFVVKGSNSAAPAREQVGEKRVRAKLEVDHSVRDVKRIQKGGGLEWTRGCVRVADMSEYKVGSGSCEGNGGTRWIEGRKENVGRGGAGSAGTGE